MKYKKQSPNTFFKLIIRGSMTTKPTIYKYEELLKVEKFVPDYPITTDTFANVVCEYHIVETELKCCLIRINNKCSRPHNKGYVVELQNGNLSIIGKDCAHNYFAANSQIKLKLETFDKELAIRERLSTVYKYVEKYEHIKKQLDELHTTIEKNHQYLFQIKNGLGANANLLNERYKVDKPTINVKTYKFGEKDNLIYQATYPIGNIESLSLFSDHPSEKEDLKKLGKLSEALRDAKRLEIQLKAGNEIKNKDLKEKVSRIMSQLRDLDDFIATKNRIKTDIHKFINSDLSILCYLSTNPRLQENAANFILELNEESMEPSKFIRQLELKLSTKFKCHRVHAE